MSQPEDIQIPGGVHLALCRSRYGHARIEAVDASGARTSDGVVAAHDDNGTLLTGSLQDYTLPRAEHVPEIEWDSTVTECPHNSLGVKGVGEAGAIAAPPAIVNAVRDALEPFGVEDLEMPLTPERVWREIDGS